MQRVIFLFGITEMCIGFSGVILSDFFSIFDFLTILSGAAGIVALVFCITQPTRIKVYDLLGMALILAYGTGTLNSLVSYSLDNMNLLKSSSVDEYWLSRTLGFATAAAGFLHFIGRFDHGGFLFQQFDLTGAQKKRALWLVGLTVATTVYFIATGKLGFMANIQAVQGYVGISSSASVVYDLILPVGALALYLGIKEDSLKLKFLLIGLAMFLLFLQFSFGRRIFVFSTLIYIMSALVARKPENIISLRNITFFLLIAVGIQFATTAYYTMRVSGYSYKNLQKSPSILERIPDAIQTYKDRDRLHLAEQMHENLSSRTFVLEYLAMLEKSTSTIELTYGENMLRALVVATPSLLYPSKYKNKLFTAEEGFLNPHFRLPSLDLANSVLTSAVGDFGEVGLFIIPVIVCFIFSCMLRISYHYLPPIGGVLISFYISYRLISVEEDIGAYFTSLRFVIILLCIAWAVFVFKSRIKSNSLAINNPSLPTKLIT